MIFLIAKKKKNPLIIRIVDGFYSLFLSSPNIEYLRRKKKSIAGQRRVGLTDYHVFSNKADQPRHVSFSSL